ncbi:MAG: DNA-3-methyladenine glycosylase [Cyclobacteriaceae bacterium]|nr:DNA-3-methyladenine glycosylase [Cyclobacteriaceae bacterium]
MKLNSSFYQRNDVVQIARQLIGKQLVSNIEGKVTAGLIVETEAYSWKEKGCHAFNNRRTARTEVMFANGGVAYVYLCYGMYNLFNIVTNKKDKAEAVLVRAVEPVLGIEHMRQRRGNVKDHQLSSGPGKLTQALGISRKHNGIPLNDDQLWIEEGMKVKPAQLVTATRIGIDYAGEDANLPWRFYLRDNIWVSKK